VPELPEVETIRRQLRPRFTGKTIDRIDVPDPLVTAPAPPRALTRPARGRTVADISRRGKYLLFELDSGDTLVIHLRMTGRLTATSTPLGAGEKDRLRLLIRFRDKTAIAFHDVRRFGKALLLSREQAADYWARRLGPEPLERSFNGKSMESITGGRRRPIKSLLLDQRSIAGIGNIYADEALYEARIHPLREAGSLTPSENARLAKAIKATLRRAIRLQGSSIDTYRDTGGRRGRFQETFRVHRRQGEPCPACDGIVEKIKVGGRGTYFCPACQLPPVNTGRP